MAEKKKGKTPARGKTTKTRAVKKTRTQEKKQTATKKVVKAKQRKEQKAKKKPLKKAEVRTAKIKPKKGQAVKKQKKSPARPSPRTAGKKVRRKSPLSPGVKASGGLARQETLRGHLIQKREEIVKEAKNEIAKYIKGETTQLVDTALDDGDWSVIDLSADINLRRLETHRESLLRIDAALMKLREGSYGICEDCGEEISAERLNAMPFAIYCRDCQEKREELDKVTREEVI